jgi:CheY-like chemotaxis protein
MARILIIDDDPDMVLASRLPLEAAGHSVDEACNGLEGLERIKANRPDLIILDVMMDTATEGFQLALQLRSREPDAEFAAYRDIPIIMLTAIHTTTPLRFGPEEDYLPVDDFIDKPIDPDVLVSKVEALVKK